MNWNLLSILLSVTTVFSDVPDSEDAVWVSDADLDVGFFTDPTPRPGLTPWTIESRPVGTQNPPAKRDRFQLKNFGRWPLSNRCLDSWWPHDCTGENGRDGSPPEYPAQIPNLLEMAVPLVSRCRSHTTGK